MVTAYPSIALKTPAKSARCMGSSFLSAIRRSFSLLARIMACMCGMRSSAKNMCSVRHSPIPSAPKVRAWIASRGISAFARTFSLRNGSAHFMKVCSSLSSGDGGKVFSWPLITRPVVPSSEIQSPALNTWPLTRISRLSR